MQGGPAEFAFMAIKWPKLVAAFSGAVIVIYVLVQLQSKSGTCRWYTFITLDSFVKANIFV